MSAQYTADTTPAQPLFDRPIFIVSSPRAGSTMLFETLSQSPAAWTIGNESHAVIEHVKALHPQQRGFESNRLTAQEATPEIVAELERAFLAEVRDRDGQRPPAGARGLRLLEKTPKNSLRVPFLAAAFPNARFVYLYRDPRETVSSMLDAWRSGRFTTYPQLPGWTGSPWSLLLVPGWRDWEGKPLAEIVVRQWEAATRTLLDDLEKLPPASWCVASYDQLVASPKEEIERICRFLDIGWDRPLQEKLPLSRHTLSAPDPEKWRHNAADLRPVMPLAVETAERARQFFATAPAAQVAAPRSPADAPRRRDPAKPPATGAPDFKSAFTASMPRLLSQIRSSLLVSTYQSGRVVAVRVDGDTLNTHFRAFASPMGMARGPRALAIGTLRSVWLYRNQPATSARLDPPGRHDACFLPARCHITGDIRVHEMAFIENELWIVATRFSCLATLDNEYSFRPQWRPPFITALAAEDRCHLNGLTVIDGRVRYVTALGTTDTPQGWRERKADGGCLIDVDSGEIAVRGLSMPHSPRWHAGKLWLLESGKGTLCVVDPASGQVQTVAELPGFTRGLAFSGPFAFVGLSQVRESVFGGIPLAQRLKERQCGVWVVDTRTGQTVGFLRFEGHVQEIFDILLLPNIQFPELVEPDADITSLSFCLAEDALRDVPSHQKTPLSNA
ncbi:MAG: TIGR03032 family protein [bacterium]